MNRTDYRIISSLILLAVFIWLRDTTWVFSASDTLPILLAIPCFFWLGKPWDFSKSKSIPPWCLGMTALLILAGIVTDFTFLLALGWTLLLGAWLHQCTAQLKKLLILPLMAFPWIALDAEQIGWWFRLSGAWTTAHLFSALGLPVIQEGTHVLVEKIMISVEAACSGLNTLQSMLIAGTAINFLLLGETSRYWWNLFLLVIVAWVANTLRIIALSTAALTVSPEFALGPIHTWGGALILILMFVLCWFLFSLQIPKHAKS